MTKGEKEGGRKYGSHSDTERERKKEKTNKSPGLNQNLQWGVKGEEDESE